MRYLICLLIGHAEEKTSESVDHEYFECTRCGERSRYKKPQKAELPSGEIRTTPSGHTYEMGVAHDCDDPQCPAGSAR